MLEKFRKRVVGACQTELSDIDTLSDISAEDPKKANEKIDKIVTSNQHRYVTYN